MPLLIHFLLHLPPWLIFLLMAIHCASAGENLGRAIGLWCRLRELGTQADLHRRERKAAIYLALAMMKMAIVLFLLQQLPAHPR